MKVYMGVILKPENGFKSFESILDEASWIKLIG